MKKLKKSHIDLLLGRLTTLRQMENSTAELMREWLDSKQAEIADYEGGIFVEAFREWRARYDAEMVKS